MTKHAISIGMALGSIVLASACDKPSTNTSENTSKPVASAAPRAIPELPTTLAHDLGKMAIPEDNPQSDAKVALGHQLFFDKRLSVDGSRSCYSCHQNEDGNGGHDPIAIGAGDKKLTRHSPVIWNVGYQTAFYWDGRSPTLEAQGTAAWAGGNMGVGKDNLVKKAKEIEKIPGYAKQFKEVFPKEGVTPDTIIKAIAAYERTLVCDDTAYDKFAKGDKKALTDEQQKGLALFMSPIAGCTTCHTPPAFSIAFSTPGGAYFNTGAGTEGKPEAEVDQGRMASSKKTEDWAAFKPPSLRNVAKSAPYFHDGSVKTLDEAVRFMASGGKENKNRSTLLSDKKLTDTEIKLIVAFLGALDCNKKLDEPKLP
jgi:cytochrome c peroxidase